MVDRALANLSPAFTAMYAAAGRPSIPPDHLLKGCLLIALCSIRSERQFCERLQRDLLFKWFLDLNIEDAAFNPSTFSKNKEWLLEQGAARQFFAQVAAEARQTRQARGSQPSVNFRGERRTNETRASRADPEARLARKGKGSEAKLCFAGRVLMENRHGLVADVAVRRTSGTAELAAALERLAQLPGSHRATVGADKGMTAEPLWQAAGRCGWRTRWRRRGGRRWMGGRRGIQATP